MKFLFVDDSASWLQAVARAFRDNPDVCFAECHSVTDALRAIAEYRPDTLFLDHSFTEGGEEGFEIADRVKGVKVYSTSSFLGEWAEEEYKQRGVTTIGKSDMKKLRSIIAKEA